MHPHIRMLGESAYAHYSNFTVGDSASGYTVSVSGYDGTAGDCLAQMNGMKFSTFDNDQDRSTENCSILFKGGWWYNACHCTNPNGLYHGGSHASYADGVNWAKYKSHHYSLRNIIMKIRQK